MAKQPNQPFPGDEGEPRTPKKPPQLPKDEDSGVVDAEPLSHEAATPRVPPRRRTAPPTMIGKAEPHDDTPGMPGALPAAAPNLSLDNDDDDMVVEAVLAEGASDVLEVSAVSEADVIEAMPVSDVVEAMPISDVFASEVVEVMPASGVLAEEVLGEEAIAEAMPASGAISGEMFAEAVEAGEPSSATRHSESVFGDEPLGKGSQPVPAKSESAVFAVEIADDVTDIGAEPTGLDPQSSMIHRRGGDLTDEQDVLGAEEASLAQVDSGVLWDDAEAVSGAKPASVAKTADFGQTIAFEPGKTGAGASTGDDFLVTEDDLGSADAIDLGDMPPVKKSGSMSGYDPVAEALESGVLDDKARGISSKSSPSVEFDDLLTEEAEPVFAHDLVDGGDSSEIEDLALSEVAGKGKKSRSKAEEAIGEAIEAESAEMFDDSEVAEAIEEVAEAEDAEAFADEPKSKKKGKRGDDEDDDPKAKNGKKGKEPAPVKPSYGMRWMGGILVGTLLTAGAVGGVGYFSPDHVKEALKFSPDYKAEVRKELTPLSPAGKAKEKLVEGNFQEAFDLVKDAGDEETGLLKMRAEARWRLYVQQQVDAKKPLDAKNEAVVASLADLDKAKDTVGRDQIVGVLSAPLMKAELDKLAKAQKEGGLLAKQLEAAVAEKEQAEKALAASAKVLADAKFIDDPKDFDAAALQKVLKDLGDKQGVLAAVNKLLEDAKIKDAGDKGVQAVLAARKDADDKIAAINKLLEGEKTKAPGAEGLQEIVDARNKSSKDRDDLDKTLKAAFQELVDGKLVAADGDPRKQLVEGTKLARQKAESPLAIPLTQVANGLAKLGAGAGASVQRGFDLAKMATEVGFYRAREPFVQTPAQKLDAQAAVLQDRSSNDPEALSMIAREAAWVLASKDSSADAKAKALYVTGLALRNEAKYAEAKQAIEQAVKGAKDAPWAAGAKRSLAELTDPKAYYLPRIEKNLAAGDTTKALQEVKAALDAIPNHGALLVQRGLIQLQASHGKLAAATQQQIRADAAAAAKDTRSGAEAAYLVGLLEEELGNISAAEKQYRSALQSAPVGSDEAGKYRAALGRLLLRDRTATPPEIPAPQKQGDDTSYEPARPVFAYPFATLVAIAVIGQTVDEQEDPAVVARLKETVDLAKELQQSTNPKIKGQGHMLLGQALAKQGKRTEGLKEYTKGLELMFPGLQSREMSKMVDEHPAFQQPDLSSTPNPVLAERHYGQGLNYYWTRQYADAEAQFKKAVELYGHDARYQYFLGLSQLSQKGKAKRDAAYYSFELGGRLETHQRPSVNEINFSLERVQGDLRSLVNSFRSKAYEVKH